VSFTSNESGSYYYQLNGTAPTAATLVTHGTGAAMVAATNTINLSALTTGSHTIYIAAKDAIGNVSNLLTITIPEFTSQTGPPTPTPPATSIPPNSPPATSIPTSSPSPTPTSTPNPRTVVGGTRATPPAVQAPASTPAPTAAPTITPLPTSPPAEIDNPELPLGSSLTPEEAFAEIVSSEIPTDSGPDEARTVTPWWLYAIIGVVGVLLGLLVLYLIKKKKEGISNNADE
jgi:LPXTG-motif cell wall-anchored protein